MTSPINIRLAVSILFLNLLAGCQSTHNFRTDGHSIFGGGFYDQEIRPGLYKMVARSNIAPWPSFSAARSTWHTRADDLCGKDAYQEVETGSTTGQRNNIKAYVASGQLIRIPQFNATVTGYILCDSSNITGDEAVKYLEALPALETQELVSRRRSKLDDLGGQDCNTAAVSAENLYRRGKVLMDLNEYNSAMSCFIKAQEKEADSVIYRNSCSEIGMMYELGWGVVKDLTTAKAWYKKTGH